LVLGQNHWRHQNRNNVPSGANSVVAADIPDTGVVVSVPDKIISYKESAAYINRSDY
jgi:serine acetyltransferase